MKIKILFVFLSVMLILSALPFNFEISAVRGSVGSMGAESLYSDSTQTGTGVYTIGTSYNNKFFLIDGVYYGLPYICDQNLIGLSKFKSSSDAGASWDVANAQSWRGSDKANSKAQFMDGVFDEVNEYIHIGNTDNTGSFPYELWYRRGTVAAGTITIAESIKLYQTNTQQMYASVGLMGEIPVVAAFIGDADSPYHYLIQVYFGDAADPTSFSEVEIDVTDTFGNNFMFPQIHAVNSTTVFIVVERVDSFSVYGFFANTDGVSGWIQISSESLTATVDSNNFRQSTLSSYSENTMNSSAYATEIALAYVDVSNVVKFAVWDVETETLGDVEEVFDEGVLLDAYGVVLAKDLDTYFLGYVGNRTAVNVVSFFIWERTPSDGSWSSNLIDTEISSTGKLTGYDMSRTVLDGKLWISYMKNNNLDLYMFTVTAEGALAVAPPTFTLSADLEDVDDGGADWVFTNWRYYSFNASFNMYATNISMQFTVSTSFEDVTVGFFANSTYQAYSSNMDYTMREGEPIRLGSTSFSFNASGTNATNVIFPLFFEDLCLDLWDESTGVDIYGSYNGSEYSLMSNGNNFFRVYSKGGFTLNAESSNSTYAWLIDGGTPFSFHVEDEGVDVPQWMYNEIWSRDVQHMKLMPDINFLAGLEEFTVKYGVDYSIGDGEWLTGWWLNIQPDFVSYTGIFAANVWINMTTTYNDRLEIARVTDSQYMFYHGSVTDPEDPGHWKLWVDLWFSDKNASSVGSARINAYEFPMIDNADLWLRWLANNWGVKDDVDKELQGASSLWDASNDTMSSERIKMVRFWSNITVYSAGAGQTIEVRNFEAFDLTHSQQLPLTGVSSPVFDETITPTVGAKGILGALWTMFSGLGSWLSENVIFGGLNLWSTFVNFLDTIAGMLGAPKFFTNLFTWIGESVGYIGTAFSYMIDIIGDVFTLFASLLGAFLDTMGQLITSLVNTVTIFTDMMGGAYGAGVNIWETLGISSWLTVAMIFYPLYLLILWDTEGMDAVVKQLTLIFGLLSWVFTFMSGVVMNAIGLITALIESIPVAE